MRTGPPIRPLLAPGLAAALTGALMLTSFAGELPPGEKPVERKLNPALLNLAANTWVHLKTARNPIGRSYSGICYGGGCLFYFGGGHGSHQGNDVELYETATNTWIQATECESVNDIATWEHLTPQGRATAARSIRGGSSSAARSPKGRPLTLHTYQMHCWFPEDRAFYNQIGGGLWAFHPDRRVWKHANPTAFKRGDVHTQNLAYDPELKTIFTIVAASADRGVHVYDPQANTWARKHNIPTTAWSEVYSAYDSARKLHVVRCGRKWWTLDMATGQTRVIADLDEALARAGHKPPQRTESLSMDYDPGARLTLAIVRPAAQLNRPGTCQLWAYDAAKDAWSEVEMAGQPPAGIPNWNLMAWDPEHKCHLFVNVLNVGGGGRGGRTDGVFAFRLKRAPEQ